MNAQNALVARDESTLRQQIKSLILKDASDAQIDLAIRVCDRYGFDPLLKHVCFISANLYVTRDGLLDNAHRSGVFDGIEVEAERDTDGKWIATARVWRKDFTRPFVYSAYQPEHEVGNSSAWRKSPRAMTVKCAEVMALRRAFNISLGSAEEMGMDEAALERTSARVVDGDGVIHEPAPMRLPLGLRAEQWDNLCRMGREVGVEFDPRMTDNELAGAIRTAGGPAIPGQINPRAVYEALQAMKRAKEQPREVTAADPIRDDEIVVEQ